MGSETGTLYLVSVTEAKNHRKNNVAVNSRGYENVFVRQSYDVISKGLPFECGMRMLTAPHPTSAHLQKVINEFLGEHHIYMTEALRGLHLSVDNVISVYTSIASEIVRPTNNSSLTWGRVVLLYALGRRMAQLCFKEPSPAVQTFIVHVGKFVESKAGHWIEHQGGWQSIYDVFGNERRRRGSLFPNYIHAIAGYLIKAFDYSNPIPFELLKF